MNQNTMLAAKELRELLVAHRQGHPWATDATIRAAATALLREMGLL